MWLSSSLVVFPPEVRYWFPCDFTDDLSSRCVFIISLHRSRRALPRSLAASPAFGFPTSSEHLITSCASPLSPCPFCLFRVYFYRSRPDLPNWLHSASIFPLSLFVGPPGFHVFGLIRFPLIKNVPPSHLISEDPADFLDGQTEETKWGNVCCCDSKTSPRPHRDRTLESPATSQKPLFVSQSCGNDVLHSKISISPRRGTRNYRSAKVACWLITGAKVSLHHLPVKHIYCCLMFCASLPKLSYFALRKSVLSLFRLFLHTSSLFFHSTLVIQQCVCVSFSPPPPPHPPSSQQPFVSQPGLPCWYSVNWDCVCASVLILDPFIV